MKCPALNVDFNGVRFDPLGSRSPPYERIKFGYPLKNVRFLLLSTNLARELLQIDTDSLLIITSIADDLSGGYQHRWPWTTLNPQNRSFSEFLAILGCNRLHILRVNCAETIQDRPGQPAYEMFGTKLRFQRCKAWPLGSRSPPYERIKFGYTTWKRAISATERPWTPKIWVLSVFLLF